MSILYFIYNIITKKLLDVKDVHKYTISYQTVFDIIISFFIDIFDYTYHNTKIYFQTMILININFEYYTFILIIEKN